MIGCYGFFLPGKGVAQLIEALPLLHRTRPGLRLRLVNADYGAHHSTTEIERCRELAGRLGVADSIEWETRFLPDADSLALLSGCEVVVIPTQASLESSSAAVRTALAAGRPVVVTPLPLFDDVGDAVVRARGTGPRDLAATLDGLLSDEPGREAARLAAAAWMGANRWAVVGARFQGMLAGLAAITDT